MAIHVAAAIGCSRAAAPQVDLHPVAHQNVLLITIDTLRADALGCYGGPAATPALDRLARDGVRFDFAHSHAVLTLPSHASILTGQYPFQHGLRDNSGYRLPAGARTAATILKQAGYSTAAFVAGFPLHSRFGLNQGFDVYDDRFRETRAPTEFDMPERRAADVVPLARAWIAEHSGGRSASPKPLAPTGSSTPSPQSPVPSPGTPWFLWLHLFDPHAPYRPPAPFDATYADRPYFGEVAATDAALAPLLDDLRSSPAPTLVIVTSDHGEALGDHGEQTHGLFAYEATLRVPLIVTEVATTAADGLRATPAADRRSATLSGSRSGGEVSFVPARHVDILPTLLEAVRLPSIPDLPGRTLLPAEERRADDPPVRASYFEAMSAMLNRGWAPLSGVLVDRRKFIDLPIAERYDLASDAGESSNLAGRSASQDQALLTRLRAFNATAPGQRLAESADAAARLRSLGYVSGSAAPKARYSAEDDPKRLVELDRSMHDAVTAFDAGRIDDALRIYRLVIDRRPDMALAYRHAAFIESQRGNLRAAIDVLERAVAKGVTDSRVIGQLGEALVDAGDAAQGIQVLEPVARAPDADVEVLNALGIAYATAGRREDARRTFQRVLAIDPGGSVPLENLAMLALEGGDVADARRLFERAIAANPTSSRAYSGLGVVSLREGRSPEAINAWKRAVQLDARNFDALYNLATTMARTDRAAARPYLEQFVKTAPPARYAKDREEIARLLRR